ncbi:MFS transporter [Streptomyces sp. CA-278952]|uniref:MFS transporter n=1 Tax=Streptomyces sp. CA-278952 TaxID=2980556 RepID=UPI0023681FE7|nr:MFS transporter [Streptomyces sp. CA-278952]WDG31495.1 MFS transporter [Streptomyces sp. CA-278952]
MPELKARRERPRAPVDEASPTARVPAAVYAVPAVSALGGLLFGYDTGIISGALLHLREDLGGLTSREQEIVVSVILLGAMAGALVSGRLAVRHGRRKVVIAVAVVFALGAAAAAAAAPSGGQ